MIKRTIALVLAVVLCLGMVSMLAGCNSGKKLNKADKLLGDDVVIDGTDLKYDSTYTIDYWLPDNTDIEMETADLKGWIEEAVNVKLNITEYESRDQYETLIAQQKIPALTFANAKIFGPAYGPLGAYIDWNNYIDQMPNVKKYLKSEEYAKTLENYTEEDGSIYQLPLVETGFASVTGFLYRVDIFEKHNLTFPTNQEEFYNTLKELKRLYPSSYPFVMRGFNGANLSGLTNLADLFDGEYYGLSSNTLYRQGKDDTYYMAQTSNEMRECLQWLHKLYQEGLLHPACLTMDTAQWMENLGNNTSFITYDKMDRIQQLTMAAQDANSSYKLMGAPGFKMGTNGDGTHAKPSTGFSLLVSGSLDADNLLKVLKFVDWWYSDKAIELTNWGKEGISYEVVNGEKQFKKDYKYEGNGLGIVGLVAYKDFDVYCKSQDENVLQSIALVMTNHTEVKRQFRLTYEGKEQTIFDTYFQKTYDICQARFQEFIEGKKNPNTSDWDEYVAEVNSLVPQSMLDIHNAALKRYLEKYPEKKLK